MIGQKDGSPRGHQIAAWLDQLTDEEVLGRMSGLQVTHNYDPEMPRRFEVLESPRHEALGIIRRDDRAVEK